MQACHAAQYSGFRFTEPDSSCSLVLLQVANEYELFAAYKNLSMAGVKLVSFFEPDHDRGLTAIASSPLYDEEQKKLFLSYQLWRQ